METLTIHHKTDYSYRRKVQFGEHRLMFRPRGSHDLRLIETRLAISPDAKVHWLHDVFNNSVAVAQFDLASDHLSFDSTIVLEHYGMEGPDASVEDFAQSLPFSYLPEEIPDIARLMERHYPDPLRQVDAWARGFLNAQGYTDTMMFLKHMTEAVRRDFTYAERFEEGVLSPQQTLANRRGSCRDFALLLMEGLRSVGLAARFVSGYLYDPAVETDRKVLKGTGHTHAWAQVYIPGAGWLDLDPTNGILGGPNLIRVATARDPSQAVPLQGSFFGDTGDFIEMKVDVSVHKGNILSTQGHTETGTIAS